MSYIALHQSPERGKFLRKQTGIENNLTYLPIGLLTIQYSVYPTRRGGQSRPQLLCASQMDSMFESELSKHFSLKARDQKYSIDSEFPDISLAGKKELRRSEWNSLLYFHTLSIAFSAPSERRPPGALRCCRKPNAFALSAVALCSPTWNEEIQECSQRAGRAVSTAGATMHCVSHPARSYVM